MFEVNAPSSIAWPSRVNNNLNNADKENVNNDDVLGNMGKPHLATIWLDAKKDPRGRNKQARSPL